jgi:uncharacterized HAD superfamily protein
MINIAIDLDNTILNTPVTIINLHNKLYKNKRIEYDDNVNLDWKFRPVIKTDEELTELFKLFDHKDFYRHAIVYKYAKDIINGFSKKNKVCIISKHMDSRKPLTREWIEKNFPRVDLIFVDNFEDKGRILQEFGADIIIDDRVDALESCIDIVPYRICFGDYDWNKQYNSLKATDWKELYKMIKNIKDIIESNNKLIEINNNEGEGIKVWEF